MVVPFYIPIYETSSFSTSSWPLNMVGLFNFSHINRCVMVSHCSLNKCFPNDSWCWASFMCLLVIQLFPLIKCLFRSFTFLKLWLLFYCWVLRVSHVYSGYKSSIRYIIYRYFLSAYGLSFIFLMLLFKISYFQGFSLKNGVTKS